MPTPKKGTPEYEAWYERVTATAFKRGQTPHNKGVPQSEAQLAKLSAVRKGRTPWNKGKKGRPLTEEEKAQKRAYRHTEEAKAKMSQRTLSAEHRAAISRRNKDRVVSAETRAKISSSEMGKEVSAETRMLLSETFTGRPNHKMRGYKHDETFSTTRSEINRLRWQGMSEDERWTHLDKLHEGGRNITNSSIEEIYAERLDKQGIAYERQKRIGWYRVDFYIPSENKAVEINGCFWHGCEQCQQRGKNMVKDYEAKREKDALRYEYLRHKGYTVEIVWEHDLPRKR